LLLEQLESRQMMAGDVDMLFTSSAPDTSAFANEPAIVSTNTTPEGEQAPDLVAFAKALTDAGVTYYGAAWCSVCTSQKQLFGDGGDFLPFVEVTRSDRTLNAIGVAAGIEVFPTWEFPDGSRATGQLSLSELSQRSGVAIPQSSNPSFVAIGNQTVAIGSPLHVPVNAYNPAGGAITVTVQVANPDLLEAVVLSGNRSIRMSVAGYGDMVFELFEDRAPRPASRVITLAESGFYDNTIFHRIIDNFVIQGGDPTGTGTGGSPLGNFDDQFHPDLQHNRTGVLSFAKSSDDTNNSQFFITEGAQRSLDFNHSVFGQLVEGEKVREAISEIADLSDKGTNSADKPLINIVLNSVTVFDDTQNSVVMLKAKGDQSGTTNVTFTATNASGETFTEVVTVSVVADSGVGSNSAPFLADIPTPAAAPNTAPVTLQLSSTDVEGDPVEYFVTSQTTGVSATVNSTGLVTVTPTAGFVGTANVLVGVRPAPGVAGTLANQSDTQLVPFTFVASQTATAPTSVSLAAASDTGASDSDRITRAGSLVFNVAGVQTGAEVILFAGSVEIGRVIAQGTTATLTTSNVAALGDGTYQITARQVVGTQTSPASPAISITYDSTPPVRVENFPTQANVGIPLSVDLSHPEEGLGLVYGLTSPPAGATIDPQSGLLTWTPTQSQLGTQSLTLTLTDVAGNVRSETFTVSVAGTPLAGVRLEVADLNGTVVTRIDPDQEFLLRFYARDLRSGASRAGIFAAFTDITFDSSLVTPVTSVPIEFSPGFGSAISSGSFADGLIDELGAVANSIAQTNRAEELVATVRMRAVGQGTVTFVSDPADLTANDFLLFNEDTEIPPALITYGRVDLAIGGRFTAVNDHFTVAQGAASTTFDVLANDTFATGVTGTLTLTSVSTPSAGGTATVQNNRVVYQPLATFVGTETFTYVATDETGLTRTATVTVTVTGSSAAQPTAVNNTFTVVEDAAIATFDVLANDIPAVPGNTIAVTAVGTSSNGSTVEIVTGGTGIRYRPAANFFGSESITYTITDSGGGTATATVTFNVTAVNDPPPATDITRDVFRGDSGVVVATLADFGTNVDGPETLTVAIQGTPTGGGTFAVDGTTIRYTPPSSTFVGTDTVTYQTTDPGGLSSTATLTINVLDSLPTTYKLAVQKSGGPVAFNTNFVATLTGTSTSGQTVNRTQTLSTANPVIEFANLAAGQYEIEIPALPFFVGMEQPQKLPFTALPAGGELTGSMNVGAMKSEFVRIEDYFSSSSTNKLFAVVRPGNDSDATMGQDRTSLVLAPIVNLNANASTVTIRGNTASNGATQASVATTDPRVSTRAVSGDQRLMRIDLTGLSFSAPVTPAVTTPASVQSMGQPEGEAPVLINPFATPPVAVPEGESAESFDESSADPGVSVAQSKRSMPVDDVMAHDSDLTSLATTQADNLATADNDSLPPDAVDQFLASFDRG